jgi:hypothetical protein
MRCSESIKGRSKRLLLVAFVAVALASCGSSAPRAVLVPAPSQLPPPGHDSPQAAVAGYMAGYDTHDAPLVCSYVAPGQQGLCSFLVGSVASYSLANWRLGNSVVRGNEAIVTILADKWCAGRACTHNDDPNKGLPPHPAGFGHAFDVTPNAVPTVSVEKIKGKWYIALA